jgi:anti-sigma-28 factor FlgM
MTVDHPDHLPALERDNVTRLKQQIARRDYRVDPEAVAREILFKLRMINIGRRALLTDLRDGRGGHATQPPDR